MFRKRN